MTIDEHGVERGARYDVKVEVRITDPIAAATIGMGVGPDDDGGLGLVGAADDVGRVREALAQVISDALQKANKDGKFGFLAIRYSVTNEGELGGDGFAGEFVLPPLN
jgi:hypothetical protein